MLRRIKWDEATITTTLRPSSTANPVRSSWSVMVVRERIRIVWPSGRAFECSVALGPNFK